MGAGEAGLPTFRVMNECIYMCRRTACCRLWFGIKVTQRNIFIYTWETQGMGAEC